MFKTLIEYNGRGQEVYIKNEVTGDPKDDNFAPFDMVIETGKKNKCHLTLTYKEAQELIYNLQCALDEACNEWEVKKEEQEDDWAEWKPEDTRTDSEIFNDILKGYYSGAFGAKKC